MKGLLNLGKCQARNFTGQIASISLSALQYNILGYVKRFDSYETIGECRDYSSHEGNKHLMMLFETYLKVHKVAWNSNAIVELIIKSVEQFSKHVFVVHHASEFLQLACIIGVFEP